VTPEVEAAVNRAFREEWGRIVATLIRLTGDWDLAEECAQDAFTRALERWGDDGTPRNPGAWLTTAARNRAIDRLRRDRSRSTKDRAAAHLQAAVVAPGELEGDDDGGVPDERLRLIFTCCHPALSTEAQVCLTLRTLAGLSTAEIARAFLVTEATMAKRLARAKAKIRHAGIPYRVPSASQRSERTGAVLGVVYLLFNEGYRASAGEDLIRRNLCAEAVRLARTLVSLVPGDPEVLALLSLLLLHDARRTARTDVRGDLVPLEEQDRTRWDAAMIAEGTWLLARARRSGPPGPYQLQASIAACHATAAEASATDWAEIARLYGRLVQLIPTPVVALNRAVAVAMAEGPASGLVLVDQLEASGSLTGYNLLPATRADLLRRLGRHAEAAAAYREALAVAATGAERRYLTRRLAEVGSAGATPPI
jgi:RNA polymerase sigma-70 factor (ECF subfamily)